MIHFGEMLLRCLMVVRTAESKEKRRSHFKVLEMCMVVMRTTESEEMEEWKERKLYVGL